MLVFAVDRNPAAGDGANTSDDDSAPGATRIRYSHVFSESFPTEPANSSKRVEEHFSGYVGCIGPVRQNPVNQIVNIAVIVSDEPVKAGLSEPACCPTDELGFVSVPTAIFGQDRTCPAALLRRCPNVVLDTALG